MLKAGFDDWIRIWINGREVHAARHDRGFAKDSVKLMLPAGETSVLVKLSNFDNQQWRLRAFTLRLET